MKKHVPLSRFLTRVLIGSATLCASPALFAACTYSVDNEWGNGYTASITIKNDTNATVNDWRVNWNYATNRVTNSWNANLSTTLPYAATNMSWNGRLGAGESVSFGFQVDKQGGSAERPALTGSLCSGSPASVAPVSSRASSSVAPVVPSSVAASSVAPQPSSSSSVAGNNIAVNGGVESGSTNWGVTSGTFTRSLTEKRSGQAGALISGRTSGWHGLTFAPGALRQGSEYGVEVWVKLAAGAPDTPITLTAKRVDDATPSTYEEFSHVSTITASSREWRVIQGYYTQLGSTAFQHFILESSDTSVSFAADDFVVTGDAAPVSSAPSSQTPSSSSSSSAAFCDLKAPLRWTSTAPVISPKNQGWVSVKDPSVVKYNGKYHVYATYYDTAYKSFYTSFTNWDNAQQAQHISMNGTRVGNAVAPQVFYFAPQKKWYLITQWPGSYATSDSIENPNWSAKQRLLQGEPTNALDFWVICNNTHCYLYFSRDDGKLYMSKTTIANFPNFSGYTVVMEDHRGNGNNYLFEAANVYKLDGQNKYLLMVEAYPSGPRMFRSWTATSLDGPWTAFADTDANPFAGNSNVEWPTGKWADGISHGELIRSGYDEKMTIDPCNLEFLYQGQAGTSNNYNTIPYRLGVLKLKR